jgi:putative RNA 2'-phosphotransferase
MTSKELVKKSKFLARHLRHAPEDLGLTLQPGGWVEVSELLEACAKAGFPMSRDQLAQVVGENDKKRFSFDETGEKIRANQGHSAEVDLQLEPAAPPAVLYHGTGINTLPLILAEGLQKMSRHHVHLSIDFQTAIKVGMRHGKPTVLVVDTEKMVRDGHLFYVSANGVWLTGHVPPAYLRILGEEQE